MSGHSKWSTIKRAKDAKDAKRSNLFTKLSKNIVVTARGGSDPDSNFKLKMAIDNAKSFNMPKDNITRAIKKGSGELEGGPIEELIYEGYGPKGVAILMKILTDNKKRTLSNIKYILSKRGGNLGGSGSVLWMFDLKGEIIIEQKELTEEEELKIIELGGEEIIKEGDYIRIITKRDDLQKIKEGLKDFNILSSEIAYIPQEKIKVEDEKKLLNLLEALDEDDDLHKIYTNADI